MMALVILVIALVAIFVFKAISIVKTYDDLAVNCASFSWTSIRPQDQETADSWTVEEPSEQRVPASFGTMRHAKRANA